MAVLMKDIAQRANVSVSAVSQALRNTGTLSPRTRHRIIAIAKEMGYVFPDTERQTRLAVVCPDGSISESEVYNGFYEGIKTSLGDAICLVAAASNPEAFPISSITNGSEEIDGVIFFGGEADHPVLQALVNHGIKCVILNRESNDRRVSAVSFDNHGAFYEATMHLHGHGHTSFAYIYVQPMKTWSKMRLEGCKEAVEEIGGQLEIVSVERSTDLTEVVRTVSKKATAILAENDVLAANVLRVASALGLRVPQDFALLGCDNLQRSKRTNPTISTIDVPFQKIGESAGQLLKDLTDGKYSYAQLVVPGELICRQSCGCEK